MGENCKGKTKKGAPCSRRPTPGLNGYCPWHYPPDGGGPKPKPDPNPKGGGNDTGKKIGAIAIIFNTAKNIWDLIEPYLSVWISLSAAQLILFENLKKAKSESERKTSLAPLLNSFSAAQLLQLVEAVASRVPASKSSSNERLKLIAKLASVIATQMQRKERRPSRLA